MSLKENFAQVSVLVVGDVMLDRYWWGSVSRISPEAPVPVVSLDSTTYAAGGAANVAANISGLGASPWLVGITGNDSGAAHLPSVLAETGVENSDLTAIDGRKTTVKTRIVAHNQQMARIDQETVVEISSSEASKIVGRLIERVTEVDAVVISDYGKGFLTRELLASLISVARKHDKPVIVDPKGNDYSKYRGATMLTPNKREAAEACGIDPGTGDFLRTAREKVLVDLELDALLITLGEDGMTLLKENGDAVNLRATARNVYDVTGAGDTVIATLAVALGSGLDLFEAAKIANLAAGLVVERVGTTPVTQADLTTIENELGN
ncbi:MAG: D-glycero-beta-D-manno-heptose-7-phosphate kinase [Pyrinomonadaceae bacterium]